MACSHLWLPEPEIPPFYYCRVCRISGKRNLATGAIEEQTPVQVSRYFFQAPPQPKRAEKRAGAPMVTERDPWADDDVRLPHPVRRIT